MSLAKRQTAFAITLLLALRAGAWPGPALDLDKLTTNADYVVVGQVASVRELEKTVIQFGDRTLAATAMVAEIHVNLILKGTDQDPTFSVNFVVPDKFMGWRSITPLSYRIFFLSKSSGHVQLTDPYFPSLTAIPGTVMKEETTIERVIDQLGAVLESTKSSLEERQEAVFALTRTTSPSAIHALQRVENVNDVPLRLSVSAALLEHNDISTLRFAENVLMKPDPSVSGDLLHNLSYAISEGVKDKNAVPSLARLLHASDTEARRAAASALMHVSSSTCIDPLLFALDDPDLEVRYYSVVGLAEITGQTEEWRPNMDDFKSAQEKYLRHWREWSKSR